MVDNDQDIGSDYVLTGVDWDILSKKATRRAFAAHFGLWMGF